MEIDAPHSPMSVEDATTLSSSKNEFPVGNARGWGCNDNGQLGLGENKRGEAFFPKGVRATGSPLASLSLGDSHAAGLTSDGELYLWGLADRGQCGLLSEAELEKGGELAFSEPTRVAALDGRKVRLKVC